MTAHYLKEATIKDDLSLPVSNLRPHLDIEQDIQAKKNGLITFIIRVHEGIITDYTLMEEVNVKSKYGGVAAIAYEKYTFSCGGGK